MRYVNEQSYQLARSMAECLEKAPEKAGILFVSVTPHPEEGGLAKFYEVNVGVRSNLTKESGISVVQFLLKEYLTGYPDYHLNIQVFCGAPGQALLRDRAE